MAGQSTCNFWLLLITSHGLDVVLGAADDEMTAPQRAHAMPALWYIYYYYLLASRFRMMQKAGLDWRFFFCFRAAGRIASSLFDGALWPREVPVTVSQASEDGWLCKR